MIGWMHILFTFSYKKFVSVGLWDLTWHFWFGFPWSTDLKHDNFKIGGVTGLYKNLKTVKFSTAFSIKSIADFKG